MKGLIEKFNLSEDSIDELVYGWVITDPRVPNVARELVFNTGLSSTVRAHTVSNNCITGIHAITSIYDSIREGRTEIGIADVDDLIPLHSASITKKNLDDSESYKDFDRAVELIWSAMMDSSENLTSYSYQNSNKKWGSKPVSDA